MSDTLSVALINQPMPALVGYISALSTIVGVIIGSLISYFIARLQFRATTISANRQTWINTVRDSVSEIQQTVSIAMDETLLATTKGTSHAVDPQAHASALRKMDLLYYRIQLLLNPEEDDHKRLINLIFELKGTFIKANDDSLKEYSRLQSEITKLAQSILKREWVRVKKGK